MDVIPREPVSASAMSGAEFQAESGSVPGEGATETDPFASFLGFLGTREASAREETEQGASDTGTEEDGEMLPDLEMLPEAEIASQAEIVPETELAPDMELDGERLEQAPELASPVVAATPVPAEEILPAKEASANSTVAPEGPEAREAAVRLDGALPSLEPGQAKQDPPAERTSQSGANPANAGATQLSSGTAGAAHDLSSETGTEQDARQRERPSAAGHTEAHQERGEPAGVPARAPEFDTALAPTVARAEAVPRGDGTQAGGSLRTLPELPSSNEAAILRGARILVNEGGGTARIQLQPPQLGGLEIRIAVNNGAVRVSLVADRTAVADLLQHHLPGVRHALQLQGLAVDRVEVAHRDAGDSLGERDPGGQERFSGRADAGPSGDGTERDGQESHPAFPWGTEPNVMAASASPHVQRVVSLGTVDLRA
jgi:flagellar hook-length control protein FliK